MQESGSTKRDRRAGRVVSAVIIAGTAIASVIAVQTITVNPRTDDAEVFANFIGMAPLVNGPVTHLYVSDNEQVKAGAPLFDIDDRPYTYVLAQAHSDLAALNGQIADERRVIAGKVSGVGVARAGEQSAEASQLRAAASINQAEADVASAKAAVQRADAELAYSTSNLHRIEPLLSKQYVTADQVDQLRTAETAHAQAAAQARAQLSLAQAGLAAAHAQSDVAAATVIQSNQQVNEAAHNVTTLEPLEGQFQGKQASIARAQYDYDNCHVVAPFEARVTNLTISQGAYAKAGQQIFTLIDTRVWWVVANFRETQLRHIRPGMHADIYVLSRPNTRFNGVVDSIGFGVTPDADLVGRISTSGLPDVQRTLNWVHLASRYPVRVRIDAPPNDLFRLGESAVVVIHGESSRGR